MNPEQQMARTVIDLVLVPEITNLVFSSYLILKTSGASNCVIERTIMETPSTSMHIERSKPHLVKLLQGLNTENLHPKDAYDRIKEGIEKIYENAHNELHLLNMDAPTSN